MRAAVRYYAEFRDEVDAWAQRMRDESRREAEAFAAEASLTTGAPRSMPAVDGAIGAALSVHA
ncbi:MAG: hypothetical protein QOC78_272 [Solirubrobacteraceae bacterium]|nr:hypothetical protein [Solirubrobacteraceae bacterium]